MTSHAFAGTLAYEGEGGIAGQERNLRFLASEPRYWRGLIGTGIAQKLMTTPSNIRTSIVMPSSRPDRLYVFLLFPRSVNQRQKEYRLERQAAITAYCHVVKHMNRGVRFVVGLATEPGNLTRGRSEDLISFDFEDWTLEADEAAANIQKEMNILTDIKARSILNDPPNTDRPDLKAGNRHHRRKVKALRGNQ